jgi:Flp pilus assembly protein TadG
MRHRLLLRRWAARRTRHRPFGQSLVELSPRRAGGRPGRRAHAFAPRSRGQAVVEFALVLPVFLLLLLIAVDFGRLFFTYIQVNNAAREGAHYAAKSPTDNLGIAARVGLEANTQAQRGAQSPLTTTASCADNLDASVACSSAAAGVGRGNTIRVNVSQPFTFFTPLINGFFNNNLVLNASATATVLDYAAAPGATSPPGACPLPTATFTITVTGLSIFVDPSASRPNSGLCNISGYNWSWGDGFSAVGTATGNTYPDLPLDPLDLESGPGYLVAGTYIVTLQTTNQAGSATATQSVTVGSVPTPPPCTKPIASFTYSSDKKVFTFRDASTVVDPIHCGIATWAWDFGDGTLGNAQNPPPVTYGTSSSHTVTLTVTNSAGPSVTYSHSQ